MFQLATTKQFEKDYKLCKKRGYKMEWINSIFSLLEIKGTVSRKYKPHKLTGNYKGFWECHIQPDWLLIWLQDDNKKGYNANENRYSFRFVLIVFRLWQIFFTCKKSALLAIFFILR